jgi:hypothetical protein
MRFQSRYRTFLQGDWFRFILLPIRDGLEHLRCDWSRLHAGGLMPFLENSLRKIAMRHLELLTT